MFLGPFTEHATWYIHHHGATTQPRTGAAPVDDSVGVQVVEGLHQLLGNALQMQECVYDAWAFCLVINDPLVVRC